MKFRVALVAVLVAGLSASLAVASPVKTSSEPTGTDTATTTTTPNTVRQHLCRPRFSLILRGTLASVADDQLSFTLNVKRVNRHVRLGADQTVTLQVAAKTQIWRLGQKVALSGLSVGDHLIVQTRNCKRGSDATRALLAVRVIARPAQAAPTTTTTTTTTTG